MNEVNPREVLYSSSDNPKSKIYLITRSARASTFGGTVQTDLLRRFEIDDELEFHRLLDRQIGGRPAFEDLVDISCGAAAVFNDPAPT